MKRLLAMFAVLSLAAPIATADRWPQHGKPSTHAKLTKRVSTAIKSAYKLKRATQRSGAPTDITWKGPELGMQTRGVAGSAALQLSQASLAYAAERGRDPIDVLTGIAVSLGIEQGRRLVKSDPLLLAALEIMRSAATSGNPESMRAGLQLLEQVLRPSTTP